MAVKSSLLDGLEGYVVDPLKNAYAAAVQGVGGLATGAALNQEVLEKAGNAIVGRPVMDEDATALRSIASGLAAHADAARATISENTQRAQATSNPDGDLLVAGKKALTGDFQGAANELSLGTDPSARGLVNNIASGLGSAAPSVALAVGTRGRSLRTQAVANGVVGGEMGGGFAAQAEGERVRKMPLNQLVSVPAFQDALRQGLDPIAAREHVARAAEQAAFATTAPVSALGDAATGALFGHAAQGAIAKAVGGGKLAHVAASGLVDAAKEGVQETAEGVAQVAGGNLATGEHRSLGEGSAQNAFLGFASGAPSGALAAVTDQHAQGEDQSTTEPPTGQADPAAPAHLQPGAPTVINPARGVLSRAVAVGAAEGHIPNVHVEGQPSAALGVPPPMGMPPALPAQADAPAEVQQFQLQSQAQAAARGMPYVGQWSDGQPLTITPNKSDLSHRERLVEAKAAQQVLSNPDAAIAAYEGLKSTEGGRIISVDDAREIFDDYGSGPEGRSANSVAVHEPASVVAKAVWQRRLAEPVAEDREPLVVFTAGGTGAGKTSAVRRDAGAQELMDAADLVYDGNLQNVDSASARINEALDSGRAVSVLYIHRDPVDAFRNGVLPRAAKESYGRTVPIDGHLATHINAAKTIFQLQDRYANNPNVHIQILNNAGADVEANPAADVARVASMEHTQLRQEVTNALAEEHQAGKLPARVAAYYADELGAGAGAQPGAASDLRPGGGSVAGGLEGQGPTGQVQAGAVALGSRAPATDAPEFQRFFQGSKVVDEHGKPLVVYHGSPTRGIQVFNTDAVTARSARGDAAGAYFSPDAQHAHSFARGPNGHGEVTAAYLNLQNPLDTTADIARLRKRGLSFGDAKRKALEKLDRSVHDGIVFRGDKYNPPEYVAFRPEQIKSADRNSGAFDPANPSILGSRAPTTSADYGVIVAAAPGAKVNTPEGARPYQRGIDGENQPPAAPPVQRPADHALLQGKVQAIFKRPAAAAALRKLFGVKGLKVAPQRGSYLGVPEVSFQLTGEGLDGDTGRRLASFLGLAFSQDAAIVTKLSPVGPDEDAVPTLELYNTDGTKLGAKFEAVAAELRNQGIDYSEARDGRALRVMHFGDEAGLEQLATTVAAAASAHGLAVNHLHTRSELYEAEDYRQHLGEGGHQAVPGQRPEVFRALVDHFVVPYAHALGAAGYRFDAERYAARYGLDADQLALLKERMSAALQPRSSVPVLTGEEKPAGKAGRATNADAAYFLQNRAAALGEIKPDDRSAKALETLSETFAQEIEYQLSKPDGKSAIGWYDRQLKNAMATIGEAHPEIARDENAGFIFKALLAVTSQGLTVEQNFNTALKAYLRYRETGKLDLNGMTLPGKAAPIAKKNVEKLAGLVESKGLDGAREWMRQPHTIRELKAQGFKDVTGRLDETARGWHAFGPKIGSFGNNLDGDFDTLTADLWFSRTWNRALGTMFQYSAQREANSLRDFRAELVKALNTPGSNAVVDALTDAERAKIGDIDADLELARRMYRHFQATRFADRSALNRAAKSLSENAEMLQDVPRGDPERRWQQQVMRATQAKLEGRTGQHISIADMQALLWYQEKELFRMLGAANKASAPLDYQDAAKAAIAQVEGKALGSRTPATILETAHPLETGSLLRRLRGLVPDARIIPLAGTDSAAARVAIDRPLTAAESAAVAKLAGLKRSYLGAWPTGPMAVSEPTERKTPARFQVPTGILADQRYAALEPHQQAAVDGALEQLKAAGYPRAWLQNASYFFAHNNAIDFAAQFYLGGETKGAVSLRQDRLGDTRAVARDLAHELAHSVDYDPEIGGFASSDSPRLALTRNADGSMQYTGDVIAELSAAWEKGGALSDELKYPFADPSEFGDDVFKAEVFAQAVMLHFTRRAALRREAPLTAAMIEEMVGDAAQGPERRAAAVQAALRAPSVRPVDLRVPQRGAGAADRAGDRQERGGPAAGRRADRPGGGRAAGADGRAGDRGRGDAGGSLAPLPGAPRVDGAAGPDPRLVEVAKAYAAQAGLPHARQAEYVKVDPARAARIAEAYDAMPHAPQDPAVKAAYADLIRQTTDQYHALEKAGYKFWLMDPERDPYGGNPWNAMRDLRAHQSMAVFPTDAGFGSGATDLNVEDNPLLADTGLRWPYGAPDGPLKPVLANDLFRAVHDAFGHGLEGAGFRADGEENAWQAHARLFHGPALAALTSETRGQNSWLNYGPHGETNRSAKVEDTVFADQKTGLMPAWTWQEGRVGDAALGVPADSVTETPAFKRWFGNSMMVYDLDTGDRAEKPIVFYHGTYAQDHFDTFDRTKAVYDSSRTINAIGSWFADTAENANIWAGASSEAMDKYRAAGHEMMTPRARVLPVYLKIESPLYATSADLKRLWQAHADGDARLANGDPDKFRAWMRSMGYDGLVLDAQDIDSKMMEPGHYVVTLEPEQVKSASANSGAFDPREASILGSRAPVAESFDGYTLPSWRLGEHLSDEAGKRLDGYKAAAAAGADKLRTYLQDYFHPVKQVQRAITARGGRVTEDSDVYGREELYYGRTGEQLRQLEDEHVKPLVKAMVAAGVKQEDLELYLYAKFAPERNARIAQINPRFGDGGSGMTNADSAQVLADFDQAGLTGKLEALAQRVRALNEVRLKTLEEGGLLSPGEAELWRQEANYVPLKGFAAGTASDAETRAPTGKGFSIGGREAQRALGRKSRATDLLANTIAQAEQAIIRAEKNRVATALLRLAEENPNPALWSVDQEKQVPYLTPGGEVAYRKDPRQKLADNVVSVKVAGTEHLITLHDQRLADAMKNLGAAKMGAFLRGFSAVNRFLSLTRTALAPEFVLANFARDLQTAAVNLTGEQSTKMAARVVKDVPVALRAMYGQLRGKQQGGEWSRWAREFSEAGGMTHFVAQRTVEEQQAHIRGLLNEAKTGALPAIRKLAKGTLGLIEDVNGAVENATRLAAYANARRSGMSAAQAARLAKNLTVNFNRKGQAGTAINALYLFYNASIQGTARFARAMKSPKVQGIMAATAVLGYGLAAANRAVGGKDDDGEDRWDKIPDWEKARNLIIFLPGGNGEMIKIPMPYTYNLPFQLGAQMEAMTGGKTHPAAAAATMAESVLSAFNPIGDLDLQGDSAVAAAKLVSPTVVDPLVDLAVNRNFFGAPINPERSPFDKVHAPDSQMAFPSANPAAKWLANALNTASGGDALHSGAIDVGPGSLVYLFDYLTGGTGSFIERTGGAVGLAAQGKPVPLRMVPFSRVFLGELDDRRVTDTFYRLRDDVNLKAEMAKTGIYDGPEEKRDALFGKRMARRLQVTERQLSHLRSLRRKAEAAGDQARVDALAARERGLQLRFNRAYFSSDDEG